MNFDLLWLMVLQLAIHVVLSMIVATHSSHQGTDIVLIMHISATDV